MKEKANCGSPGSPRLLPRIGLGHGVRARGALTAPRRGPTVAPSPKWPDKEGSPRFAPAVPVAPVLPQAGTAVLFGKSLLAE